MQRGSSAAESQPPTAFQPDSFPREPVRLTLTDLSGAQEQANSRAESQEETLQKSNMADQNPPVDDIFSGMKKKKKSSAKKVNIDEFDVDAASPAAPSNDATGSNAAVDLAAAPAPGDAADPELDFGDLKKKKKKKSVRIDSDAEDAQEVEEQSVKSKKRVDKLGNEIDDEPVDNQISAEVTAVDASGMDEFSDLKKKKKKSSKKAFDLEAFEKELKESEEAGDEDDEGAAPKGILKKSTPAGSDDEDAADDEPVEGENPFGKDGDDDEEGVVSKAEQAAAAKGWLKDDRDYTYTEVRSLAYASRASNTKLSDHLGALLYSSLVDSSRSSTNRTLRSRAERRRRSTRSRRLSFSEKVTSDQSLPTLPTFASGCTVNPSTSSSSCLPSWVPTVRLTEVLD